MPALDNKTALMRGEPVLDPHIMVSIERFLGKTATGNNLKALIENWRIEAERRAAQQALGRLKPRQLEIIRELAAKDIREKYDSVADQFGFETGGGLKDTLYKIRRHLGLKDNEALIALWKKAHPTQP